MQVHDDLKALRGASLPQRSRAVGMADALGEWRALSEVESVAAGFREYLAGASLRDAGALGRLFAELSAARRFVALWRGHFTTAARARPLGEMPFRYRCSPGLTAIRLFESALPDGGGADLSLVAYERRDEAREPESAVFAERESTELIVEGAAEGMTHRLAGKGVASERCDWKPGALIACRNGSEARQVVRVHGSMLLLQLTRTPARPGPTREIALGDARVLNAASGDKRASGRLMACAVLGALEGRCGEEGKAAMRAAALDRQEDAEVRWEALRQVIALDTRAGIDLVGALAARGDDALAGPAARLAQTLARRHPGLAAHMSQAMKETA